MSTPSTDRRYVALTAAPLASRAGLIVVEAGQVKGTAAALRADTLVQLVAATTTSGREQARIYVLTPRPDQQPPAFRVVDGPAPAGADVQATHAGVTIYRTVASLRRAAAWSLRHATTREARLAALLACERIILLAAEQQHLGPDADAAWSRYQGVKALALAPGTAAEGETALKHSLRLARKLAGLEVRA
jgi:hypothetical protein